MFYKLAESLKDVSNLKTQFTGLKLSIENLELKLANLQERLKVIDERFNTPTPKAKGKKSKR